MDTEQARQLITLHDNADRALLNLRNAGAMSSDDPRATELLETAGDAYAESIKAIWGAQSALVEPSLTDVVRATAGVEPAPAPDPVAQPAGKAPGAETPAGGGQVQNAEGKTNAEAPAPAESAPPAPQGDPKGRDEGNPPPAA